MQRASERDRFKKNRADEKTFLEVGEIEWSQIEKTWEFYLDAVKVFDDFDSGEKRIHENLEN